MPVSRPVFLGSAAASWKSPQAQIAVGINHSLRLSPYLGSDIRQFYANSDKSEELSARWLQFGAFSPGRAERGIRPRKGA